MQRPEVGAYLTSLGTGQVQERMGEDEMGSQYIQPLEWICCKDEQRKVGRWLQGDYW